MASGSRSLFESGSNRERCFKNLRLARILQAEDWDADNKYQFYLHLNVYKTELTLIKNCLLNKKMYKGAKLNLGTVVWEEWMDIFKKIQKN